MEDSITRIPITQIVSNPSNFYTLCDIDSLANTIAATKFIEPLIVTKQFGDTYLLIAGHRRRAAYQKLLDEGRVEDVTLPCIVRSFSPMQLANGQEISADQLETAYLIFSNMGQRQNRTVEERLEEIEHLRPYARMLYEAQDSKNKGNFRVYFAEKVLKISESRLQRLMALKNLIPEARKEVDQGHLSMQFGIELAALSAEDQKAYLQDVQDGKRGGTFHELQDFKKSQKNDEESEASQPAIPSDDLGGYAEPYPPAEEEPQAKAATDEPAEPDESEKPDESVPDVPSEEPQEPILPESSDEDSADTPKASPARHKPGAIEFAVQDVPKKATLTSVNFDPQAEAKQWIDASELELAKQLYAYAKDEIEKNAGDELLSAQWNLRASAAQVRILILEQQ